MIETPARLRKRSVLIAGHETSVTLEDAFWDILKRIAAESDRSLNTLITDIDATRADAPTPGNLSGAIRVYILEWLSARADL